MWLASGFQPSYEENDPRRLLAGLNHGLCREPSGDEGLFQTEESPRICRSYSKQRATTSLTGTEPWPKQYLRKLLVNCLTLAARCKMQDRN